MIAVTACVPVTQALLSVLLSSGKLHLRQSNRSRPIIRDRAALLVTGVEASIPVNNSGWISISWDCLTSINKTRV